MSPDIRTNLIYNRDYARKYVEDTLKSPYTQYKNRILAELARREGVHEVIDLGSNVSALVDLPGSLRTEMEQHGVRYTGLDIHIDYFDRQTLKDVGVSDAHTFDSVSAVVADIQDLPFADRSLECIVCADVIEHIPDPLRALSEIQRVLTESGVEYLIVPSLYKLDMLDSMRIESRRESSHETRNTLLQWMQTFEQAGLEIDEKASIPLGILSGFSYLLWLDNRYVPSRPTLQSQEMYSSEAERHKKLKKSCSTIDEIVDDYIAHHPEVLDAIRVAFEKDNLVDILNAIRLSLQEVPAAHQVLDLLIDEAANVTVDPSDFNSLKETMRSAPGAAFANSGILALRRKASL